MAAKIRQNHWVFLSYPLGPNSPAYGGGDGAQIVSAKSMNEGDSCNTSCWTFSNHSGTHLDFPRHFVENGRTMNDYDAAFFVFNRVGIVDLGEVNPAEIISWDILERNSFPEDIELLIVKTGFSVKRNTSVYWQNNPGFSPDLANALRDALPHLRVFGFDSISLSSFAHRELGRKSHKCFLDNNRPILPLEDMDLDMISDSVQMKRVIIAPWRVQKADAVPCTVMAEVFGE